MFERISRGWGIVKASWAVLKLHPKLLVLPFLSGMAFLLLVGAIAWSAWAGGHLAELRRVLDGGSYGEPLLYAAVFAFYFVSTVIIVYFNAALIFCALEAFAGRTPSLRAGLTLATRRLPQILGWALVAATVGVLLNALQSMLRDKLGFLGSLLGGLTEVAWAAITYFVVPVVVVDGVGPIEAAKRSSSILKRAWGESVVGEGGLGLVSFLLVFPAVIVIALMGAAGLAAGMQGPALLVLLPVLILYIVALSTVFMALGTIFRTGAYVYATTGKAPSSMDHALLQGAFRKKD